MGKRASVDFSSIAGPSKLKILEDEDPFGGDDILSSGASKINRPWTPKSIDRSRPRTPGRGRSIVQGDR